MAKIVVAESSHGSDTEFIMPNTEPFDSESLPVTLAPEIRRFLRVANMIEVEEPRIAYLCRFHAFEKAHNMDRNSSGQGVRQFKTSLLQRLEQDVEATIKKRKEKIDLRELRRVYREYESYIIKHGGACDIENRDLIEARGISSVLFEVLKSITNAVCPQVHHNSIKAKSEFYVPCNILPPILEVLSKQLCDSMMSESSDAVPI